MSRRWWLLAGLISLCCFAHQGMASEAAVKSAEPRWLSEWEQARKEARASGKPLFVVFRCQH